MIASAHATSTGRSSGLPLIVDGTNVYDFSEGRIKRVRIFSDHEQTLKAVGLAE